MSEQVLFRRLSVFAGGATLEAVEAVANPDHDLDIFAGLSALVDKSLLRQIAGVGEPCFSMLETIREYTAEMLSSASDRTAVEQRHANHYLAFAEQAKGMIDGPDQAHGSHGWPPNKTTCESCWSGRSSTMMPKWRCDSERRSGDSGDSADISAKGGRHWSGP